MNLIHLALGIGILLSALAPVVVAFMPAKFTDEQFEGVSGTVAGLLIVQIVVGFFLFTSGSNEAFNALLHIVPPVLSLAAVFGARAAQGDKRKILVAAAGVLVLVAGVVSYLTGLAARTLGG